MATIPALVAVVTSIEVFIQIGNARSQSVAVGKNRKTTINPSRNDCCRRIGLAKKNLLNFYPYFQNTNFGRVNVTAWPTI